MVYTLVEKVMVVAIGGPVMAEGALEVMETFASQACARIWVTGFSCPLPMSRLLVGLAAFDDFIFGGASQVPSRDFQGENLSSSLIGCVW
jgi:hypothetical protein